MLQIADYIPEFQTIFKESSSTLPWTVTASLSRLLTALISQLPADFQIKGDMAIHKTARIEEHVILKGPLIITADCFVASHAYLRQGVYLGKKVSIGPGCEIKSSAIFSGSALAHFNFVGDSLIGTGVNLEAGSIIANHYNERIDKEIEVLLHGKPFRTGIQKFGALVGDGSRIGANAVLSPGTILPPGSIVGRLALIEQIQIPANH